MEKSAVETNNEIEKNGFEVESWKRERSIQEIASFITRREAFLNNQGVELNLN